MSRETKKGDAVHEWQLNNISEIWSEREMRVDFQDRFFVFAVEEISLKKRSFFTTRKCSQL